MRTRSSRLNNGYIGDYAAHDDVNGVVGLNKKYLVNDYSIETINWTRPSEWRVGPDVTPGEQKIVITNAVYNTDNNFTAFTMGNSFSVDWGDGTTGIFAANATASKNYDKTTYSGLTSPVFRGYKTLNIVITPPAGSTFNSYVNLALKHPQSGLTSYYNNGYLEIIMSGPAITGPLTVSDATFNNRSSSRLLEHFRWSGGGNLSGSAVVGSFIGCNSLKIISDFPSTARCTDFQSLFHSCHNLEWIPPTICETQNATNMPYMFFLCNSLKRIPGNLNSSKVNGSMRQLFQDCYVLKRVPYLDTSKTISDGLVGLFSGCNSIEEIPFDINAQNVNQLTSLFESCRNLKNFPKILNTNSVTNFSRMFTQCVSLEVVPYFNISNGTVFNDMFNTSGIKRFDPQWGNTCSIPLATNISNMFRFCRGLESCPTTFVTGASLTNCVEMFYECYSLKQCPVITNISNCTNLTGLFFNCRAFKEIPGMTISSSANNFGGTLSTTRMFWNNWSLSACGMTGFTGANVSFDSASLGATALNDIYRSLAVVGASGSNRFSITVIGNWGNTDDDPLIAIAKGWQVLG